jgi:hypothetical protein
MFVRTSSTSWMERRDTSGFGRVKNRLSASGRSAVLLVTSKLRSIRVLIGRALDELYDVAEGETARPGTPRTSGCGGEPLGGVGTSNCVVEPDKVP